MSLLPPSPPDRSRKNHSSRRNNGLILLIVFTVGLAFMAGVLFTEITDSPHNNDNFEVFWNSWEILEDEYYYDLPEEERLIRGAIQGLLAVVGDPFTYLAPPDAAEIDRQRTSGEFGGIGAEIGVNAAGEFEITRVYPDHPADQAGLVPGDVITAVEGQPVDDLDQTGLVQRIRGPVGTTVSLTIRRASTDAPITVNLERARIELDVVYAEQYDDVGYVRLVIFSENATQSLETEIQQLIDNGVTALILDLRSNPGGLLNQAVSVSDLFLDEGIVVKQRAQNGAETIYRSETGDLAESLPLVVLIDQGSASASEVVAGALRDRDRAILIGQRSYGKGSVQHLHDLADGSQLHITTAIWLTPDETPIQGAGLEPDIAVDPSTPITDGLDPFIHAALQYLEQPAESTSLPAE